MSARSTGKETPAAGGEGGFTVALTVTQEPGGPALGNASAVFFWGDESASDALRGGRGVVHVDPSGTYTINGHVAPTYYTHVLRLRAGPDGTMRAKLPSDTIVGVVAAAQGWTEEWVPAFATGSTGSMPLAIPLYRQQLDLEFSETIGPGAASTSFVTEDGAKWYPQDLKLGDAPSATPGYVARLAEIRGILSWNNTPLSFGDLALGVGPVLPDPSVMGDASMNVNLGLHSEVVVLDGKAVQESGFPGARHLYAGPATRTGYFGPTGLPYTLHVILDMNPGGAFRQQCWGGNGGGGGQGGGAGGGGGGISIPSSSLPPLVALLGATAAILRRKTSNAQIKDGTSK